MLPFDFLADPVGWVEEQYVWFLHSPAWYVALCALFWPAVFARAWVMDEWDRRRRRRKKLAESS